MKLNTKEGFFLCSKKMGCFKSHYLWNKQECLFY